MSRRRTPRWQEAQPVFAPASSCPSRKRGYATREDARRAIDWLQEHIREDGDRTEAREYLCALPSCNNGNPLYHLTSDSQRQLKAS